MRAHDAAYLERLEKMKDLAELELTVPSEELHLQILPKTPFQ